MKKPPPSTTRISALGNLEVPGLGHHFTKSDSLKAVEVAEDWLKNINPKIKETIPHHVVDVMETWKHLHGEIRNNIGTFGALETGQRRLQLLKKRDPWECAPIWIKANPLDLLMHIWANNHPKIEVQNICGCAAWLIAYCGKENNPDWYAAMIYYALWLRNIQHDTMYKILSVEMPKLKSYRQQMSGILLHRKAEEMRLSVRQRETIQYADRLLAADKKHSEIVGIIAQQLGSTARTVRADLAHHESGHWLPRRQRKSDAQ